MSANLGGIRPRMDLGQQSEERHQTGRHLNARADKAGRPGDPPDRPMRCGSCRHFAAGKWSECTAGFPYDAEPWWPACILYEQVPA